VEAAWLMDFGFKLNSPAIISVARQKYR